MHYNFVNYKVCLVLNYSGDLLFVFHFVEILFQHLCSRGAMNIFSLAFTLVAPMAKFQTFLATDPFWKGGGKLCLPERFSNDYSLLVGHRICRSTYFCF